MTKIFVLTEIDRKDDGNDKKEKNRRKSIKNLRADFPIVVDVRAAWQAACITPNVSVFVQITRKITLMIKNMIPLFKRRAGEAAAILLRRLRRAAIHSPIDK